MLTVVAKTPLASVSGAANGKTLLAGAMVTKEVGPDFSPKSTDRAFVSSGQAAQIAITACKSCFQLFLSMANDESEDDNADEDSNQRCDPEGATDLM